MRYNLELCCAKISAHWKFARKEELILTPGDSLRKQLPSVLLTPISILLAKERVIVVSKTLAVTGLFEILEVLYPPEGVCDNRAPRGPIKYSFHLIGVRNGTGGIKNTEGDRPF